MKHLLIIAFAILMISCSKNKLSEARHQSEYHYLKMDKSSVKSTEQIYVPVYSDIYYVDAEHTFSLTATLSIRNTSFSDSIYVFAIDYYNSAGQKVRSFNTETLLVKPMESVEYVVENKDDTGGVGANFVIDWGAKKSVQRPYLQCVMIGTAGQQGISFTTEGIVMTK